jgi:hypothetical protein
MSDPTEQARRQRLAEINIGPGSREALEAEHGQVWDTTGLSGEFEVLGFMAPFVVMRRSDGQKVSFPGLLVASAMLYKALSICLATCNT